MEKSISIALKLKCTREEKGLSQEEMVKRLSEKNLNISRETLSKIENGHRTISAIELNVLCQVLDIDMNSLFKEYEEDDLIKLFRKSNFSQKTLEELEKLQDMLKMFIYQKKLYEGKFKPQKRKPLWEEC
ncbi:MAG: helix-turn-helix transcriptional regulator [Halanaerobiaceae bacterium]|jgi:transcriptional regulator with XRE-family HTH domain|nr:helix-turn-helix transcriptional regulator [Halanaerobiaceae bacterium]